MAAPGRSATRHLLFCSWPLGHGLNVTGCSDALTRETARHDTPPETHSATDNVGLGFTGFQHGGGMRHLLLGGRMCIGRVKNVDDPILTGGGQHLAIMAPCD